MHIFSNMVISKWNIQYLKKKLTLKNISYNKLVTKRKKMMNKRFKTFILLM